MDICKVNFYIKKLLVQFNHGTIVPWRNKGSCCVHVKGRVIIMCQSISPCVSCVRLSV